jgi:hypothetical protein
MKTMLRTSIVILSFLFQINIVQSQSWEIFFEEYSVDFFSQQFYCQVFPSENNGIGLTINDYSGFDQLPNVFKFDSEGNYIGENSLDIPLGWKPFNVDKSGSTYWLNYYSLKKFDTNQILSWTYTVPTTSGTLWAKSSPEGNTCIKYTNNNSEGAIDWVGSDGNLINTFTLPMEGIAKFYTSYDTSIIYLIFGGVNSSIWRKVNKFNQIVWEKNFDNSVEFLSGSLPDGSTIFVNNEIITKIDAIGNIEWERNVMEYFPNGSVNPSFHSIVRNDGSIVLVTGISNVFLGYSEVFFIKINPNDGEAIWTTHTFNIFSIYSVCYINEMSDGGLVVAASVIANNLIGDRVLIIRTDPQGNTLSNQISGTIHRDNNSDCIPQTTEMPLQQVTVLAQSGTKTYSATSDQNGQFTLPITGGDYQISVAQAGTYWDFCGFTNPVALNPTYDSVQITVVAQANILCPEMHVSIGSNAFRRCFDNNYLSVNYQNLGTMPANNATVTITLDPELIYISATAPLLSQNGQDYTFSIGTVDMLSGGAFSINFKVDCDAEMGKIICADAHAFPDSLCIQGAPRLSENSFCLPVVASFDPNDKTAMVNGKPETVTILPDLGLEYLIRFQNTGNDTAFNIVIVDTLSALLDATSVLPGAASHPYTFELLDGKILRFSFKNILLPDSTTNEVASHGFIKFAVRQKANNPIGSLLRNQAAIYFDYNAPIFTNDSRLVVQPFVKTQEAHTYAQPNITPVPAFDGVHVQSAKDAPTIVAWKLVDMTGRVLLEENVGSDNFFVPRHGLPSGVYGLQFRFVNGAIGVGKVIFE